MKKKKKMPFLEAYLEPKYKVVFMEEFDVHFEYNTRVQIYLILGGTLPIVAYLYESSGYYNCYNSLDTMLRRELAQDYEQDLIAAIPTVTVDTEDGQEEFEKLLIEAFTTQPTNEEV